MTVPEGAGEQIEVIVPARCLNASSSSSSSSLQPTAPPQQSLSRRSSADLVSGPPPPPGADAPAAGEVAWTLCRRFDVDVHKPEGRPLGLALAPSRAGHLTVTDVTAGGVAETLGSFNLGDMLVTFNGEALTANLDAFIRKLSQSEEDDDGEMVLGVQRVEDEAALQLLLEQVSSEQHRLELEQRHLTSGIRASQEAGLLEMALERSLSLAQEEATRHSAEEREVEAAIKQSIDQQSEADVTLASEYSALQEEVVKKAQISAEKSLIDAAIKESTEMAGGGGGGGGGGAAVDVSDSSNTNGRGHSDSEEARRQSLSTWNPVRALEEGFSSTEGVPNVETAAAARSRSGSQLSATSQPLYRSDSIKRVYEAQHHFVLAQLTAPGVEAFLADDFSDDDEDQPLSRSASKFV